MCPMFENQSSFATLYPPFLIFFSTVNKLPRPASLPPDKVVRQKKCTLMSLPVIWGDRLPKNSSLIARCQSEMSTAPVGRRFVAAHRTLHFGCGRIWTTSPLGGSLGWPFSILAKNLSWTLWHEWGIHVLSEITPSDGLTWKQKPSLLPFKWKCSI